MTAAPARTCEFMSPATLAEIPANKTGHGRSVRIGHGCTVMRHTRFAETSSTAAERLAPLVLCDQRQAFGVTITSAAPPSISAQADSRMYGIPI